jgi:hypothetical protein
LSARVSAPAEVVAEKPTFSDPKATVVFAVVLLMVVFVVTDAVSDAIHTSSVSTGGFAILGEFQ